MVPVILSYDEKSYQAGLDKGRASANARLAAALAEIQRLRALLLTVADHPETPKLIAGVIHNELRRKA